MKRTVFASIGALAALLQPAAAADMPVKARPAPVVVVADWSGWYGGIHGGYSWGRFTSTCPTNCFVGTPGSIVSPAIAGNPAALAAFTSSFTNSVKSKVDGWVAGIHAGRNWQVSSNWLFGLEGDFDWTGEKDDRSGTVNLSIRFADNILNTSLTVENRWKLNWFSTVRGRVGWVNDTWLLYATGGLAVGRVSYSVTNIATAGFTTLAGVPIAPGTQTAVSGASDSDTRVGFAVGAGIEKKITQNWIGRAEYLYIDLGNPTFFAGTAFETRVKVRDHVARVGLSYLFAPAPVVARY
jgi:outer membrane immunogenic protein